MALVTPTTEEIRDQIINQVVASTSLVANLLPRAFTRFFSNILAGVFMICYKYAGWMFLQIFVRTASFEETEILGEKVTPLIEWGRLIGEGDPNAATQAELLLDITVINQTGSIDAGTLATSTKNNITYILLSAITLDAATKQGTFRAASDIDGGIGAGEVGNLDPGDTVSFVEPLPNVERDMIVDSLTVTGVDAETESEYRQRVIDRFQLQPQGGAGVDYVIWGTEDEQVLNIYPYTGDNGFVDVYVEVKSSVEPDGIASQDVLDAVRGVITFADGEQTRKPINAYLNTYSITRQGFDINIVGLLVDDQAAVEADITDAVETYFLEREPYIDGVTSLPRKDRIQINELLGIVGSFVYAANGTFSDVTVFLTGTATEVDNLYSLQIGEKAKAFSVNF